MLLKLTDYCEQFLSISGSKNILIHCPLNARYSSKFVERNKKLTQKVVNYERIFLLYL